VAKALATTTLDTINTYSRLPEDVSSKPLLALSSQVTITASKATSTPTANLYAASYETDSEDDFVKVLGLTTAEEAAYAKKITRATITTETAIDDA
jgi:hypothetical protein